MRDGKVIRREVLEGDLFAAVYEQHLAAILGYLRRRLGDNAAEDAAAEVFLRALRAPGPTDETGATTLPWLYGIAANVIAERRRADKRRLRAMQRLAADQPVVVPDPSERVGLDPSLMRAVRKLKPADRETLLLIAWADLSYEQAAEALQIPVGTVRSRLVRVRRQLDALTAEWPTEPDPTLTARNVHV